MKGRRISKTSTRGQATVEYILLIGLIIIFIIVGLYQFRDSVMAFTDRVGVWIDGQGAPPPPPPPPPPASPPKESPAPPEKPSPEDWAKWLQGNWCGRGGPWSGNRTGPGVVNGYPVTGLGPNSFRFTHPDNPKDYTDYERLPDGTFRMTYRNLTPDQPASPPWHRC